MRVSVVQMGGPSLRGASASLTDATAVRKPQSGKEAAAHINLEQYKFVVLTWSQLIFICFSHMPPSRLSHASKRAGEASMRATAIHTEESAMLFTIVFINNNNHLVSKVPKWTFNVSLVLSRIGSLCSSQ